jgi:hypothetical protein
MNRYDMKNDYDFKGAIKTIIEGYYYQTRTHPPLPPFVFASIW